MSQKLRIAVADDETDMRDFLERMLPLCGYDVVSSAETGKELVEHCQSLKPDLVITDIKMPDMDGIDAAQQICRERPTPVILVSAHHEPELIHRAEIDYVMGYLVKPIGQADLAPAIAVALRRFQEMQALRKETVDLKQALADRKIIEQAKGILMKSTGADEKDAFHRLQQLASEKNQKLIEAAHSIIAVEKVFRPADRQACKIFINDPIDNARSGISCVADLQECETMLATVFHGVDDIRVEEVERPRAGVGEVVIRITLTTICGTDLHIVKGEYPVRPGLVIGHEPVGVIDEIGAGVVGYNVGDRVLVGAVTPCGQCRACLSGQSAQCGHGEGYEAIGGWRFGNTIDGAQAEYLLVPHAQANLAKIPDAVADEDVILLADIASTGFAGAEAGNIKIGDTVVVFAQGPIGLCATAGAKLLGASLIIGVDADETRLAMANRMGADIVIDYRKEDVVTEVKRLTDGGADVAIEALGTQQTFENCLRCLRPGGTLSSLGVYSGKLSIPYDAFAAGIGDYRIVTTLCPGGKERMRRLMNMVQAGRFNPKQLLTHSYSLKDIKEAYRVFGQRLDGVLKVAIRP